MSEKKKNNRKSAISSLGICLFFFIIIINAFSVLVSAEGMKTLQNERVSFYSGASAYFYEEAVMYGDNLYIADANYPSIRIVSVSNPNALNEVGHIKSEGVPYNIEVSNYSGSVMAFIKSRNSSEDYDIEYFDVSNAASPVKKGSLSLDYVRGYTLYGGHLFVNNGSDIIVYNVSDISAVYEETRYDIGGFQSIKVSHDGNYLYCMDAGGAPMSFRILNISELNNISELGHIDLGNFYGGDIVESGNHLYLGGRDYTQEVRHGAMVKILDISNKSSLQVKGSILLDGISTSGLALNGDTLYASTCAFGVVFLNVSDASSPVAIGVYQKYRELCTGEPYAMSPIYTNDQEYGGLLIFGVNKFGIEVVKTAPIIFKKDIGSYNMGAFTLVIIVSTFAVVLKEITRCRRELEEL